MVNLKHILKAVVPLIATLTLVACSSSSPEVNASYNHKDVRKIVPYGFVEACEQCNNGYTTKEVCGKYYNPKCNKGVTMASATTKPQKPQKLQKTDIKAPLPKINVRELKSGETLKIDVPKDSIILIRTDKK